MRTLIRGLVQKAAWWAWTFIEITSRDGNRITAITAGRLIVNLIGNAVRAGYFASERSGPPMIDETSTPPQALREAGVVGTHYHVGPELIVRRYDVKMLADVAAPFGATLLKNHTYPTTPLAALARAQFNACFFGGVVLNRYVGGLNPQAVESARSGNRASEQPRTRSLADRRLDADGACPLAYQRPWLRIRPRWSGCCNHGQDDQAAVPVAMQDEPVIVFDDDGRPAPELVPTLEAIARNNCILATGHLHAEEVKLVPMALELGIKRVILTHPHYPRSCCRTPI